MESYAFRKSIKAAKLSRPSSSLVSATVTIVNICSILPLPDQEGVMIRKGKSILHDSLKSTSTPNHVARLGKKEPDRNRLILVKLSSRKENIHLLKNAKLLRGTRMFIAEDLSKEDREKRKMLVKEMKKSKQMEKIAFIRYSDGKPVVDGKIQDNHHSTTAPNSIA